MTPMTVKITEETFDREVMESLQPVLVEFYASWCGKCAMMEDVVAGFAAGHDGRIKVCQIDADQCESLAEKYSVKKVPTFIAFRSGRLVSTVCGVVSVKTLGKLFE